MKTLLRESASRGVQEVDDLDDALYMKAQKRFGYKRAKHHRAVDPMVETLNLLDIKPFTRESVDKYKEKELSREAWRRTFANWKDIVGFGCVGGVVVGLIALSAGWVGSSFASGLSAGGIGFGIAFTVLALLVTFAGRDFDRKNLSWRDDRASDYIGPIPEFALQTAVDVVEKHAENHPHERCDVWVSWMRYDTTPTADPFLFIVTNHGMYHLEVWNEPRYKQERKA